VRLALDYHYSPLIAEQLRDRGHDVIAARDAGWQAEDDEPLLELCGADRRVLLTNNVADFVVIARRWHAGGLSHHGLVFTSDARLPRTRETIGRYVDAIDVLMREHPSLDGFIDRIHWLRGDP